MSKIFRTTSIILVLIGLLAWGVTAFAVNTSSGRISSHATMLKGHVAEKVIPISPSQIRPVSR
jgi:Na+-translocating ferredoxin:NAD+ oxidoreductase RnfG subunit